MRAKLVACVVSMVVLAGCATSGADGVAAERTRSVAVKNSDTPVQSSDGRIIAACSSTSLAVLSQEQLDALVADRRQTVTCPSGRYVAAEKLGTASNARYPAAFVEKRRAASGRFLVLLSAAGTTESVHAVCASDADFAAASVPVAQSVRFRVATCDGVPVASGLLIPLHYQPH